MPFPAFATISENGSDGLAYRQSETLPNWFEAGLIVGGVFYRFLQVDFNEQGYLSTGHLLTIDPAAPIYRTSDPVPTQQQDHLRMAS